MAPAPHTAAHILGRGGFRRLSAARVQLSSPSFTFYWTKVRFGKGLPKTGNLTKPTQEHYHIFDGFVLIVQDVQLKKKQNQRINLFGLPLYLNSFIPKAKVLQINFTRRDAASLLNWSAIDHRCSFTNCGKVICLVDRNYRHDLSAPPNNSPALCHRPKEPAS